MELIVAKFGGTSIGNGQRIRKAAQSIVNAYMEGKKVVVVVSAINNWRKFYPWVREPALEYFHQSWNP